MDNSLCVSGTPSRSSRARTWWLTAIRSKLLASTVIAFAIAFGFHEVERHTDAKLAEQSAIICQDIQNLNGSRVHNLRIKLNCDDK